MFYRKNISYVVDTTSDKKSRLLKLKSVKSSVIIYVSKRRSSEEINNFY